MANEISIVIRAKSMLAQAFSQAGSEVSAFAGSVKTRMAGAFAGISGGLAGMFGAAALAGLAKSAMGYADNIEEAGQRTGFALKRVQELSFAAGQAGASFDDIETAVKKISTTVSGSMTKEQASLFKRLGLDPADLSAASPEEMFDRVAGAVGRIESPTQRAAAAVEMFGKSGMKLLPMISDMQRLTEAAHKMGVVLSDAQIKAAGGLNDMIDALGTVAKARAAGVMTNPYAMIATGAGASLGGVAAGLISRGNKKAIMAGQAAGGLVGNQVFNWLSGQMEDPGDIGDAENLRKGAEAKAAIAKRKADSAAAATAATAAAQKIADEQQKAMDEAVKIIADAKARNVARAKLGVAADAVDTEMGKLDPVDLLLSGGGDPQAAVNAMRERRQKLVEAEREKKKALEEIADLKEQESKELQNIVNEEEKQDLAKRRKAAEGNLESAENKIKGLTGLLVKDGKIRSIPSIKASLRDKQNAADADRDLENKIQRIHAASMESKRWNRPLSVRQKAVEDLLAERQRGFNAVGQLANIETMESEQLEREQLKTLNEIKAKVDKQAGLAAKG